MSTTTPSAAPSRWVLLLLAAALAAAVLGLFWPATNYQFIGFDDYEYVANNPNVTQGLSVQNVRWAFTTVHQDWWLPLLWISYMADTELFGPEPFGYHLMNIVLHALNAALLLWVLFRLTGSPWRSAFVAALFALHPLRVESVAWITERKDVLSGLFFILALLAYVRHAERPSILRMGWVAALMLMGLMSKPAVIVLPALLLLLDYWPLRRAGDLPSPAGGKAWLTLFCEKWPLWFLAAAFTYINMRTHWTGAVHFVDLPPATRIGLIPPNYWAYLGIFFWPARLCMIYPEHDVVNWPVSVVAAAGLLALTLLLLRFRRQAPAAIVGWLWFGIALLPVIRGVRGPGIAAHADRFTYLPAIGLGLALAWTTADFLWRRRRGRVAALAAAALLLLAACAVRAHAQLPAWKDSMAAFANILKYYPDHALSNNNCGEYHLERGQPAKALPFLEKAVAGGGIDAFPYSNLGMALLLLHRPDEALQRMDAARGRCTTFLPFLDFVTGLAWMEKNEPGAAIPFFQQALRADSPPPTWHAELARAYRQNGDLAAYSNELARIRAAGFLNLASFDGLCFYYLGLWQHGHGRRALTFFQRELEQDPGNVYMMNNAAWFLAIDPPAGASAADALALAERARALAGDDHPGLLDTLALAQAANGRFAEAVQTAERAEQLARDGGNPNLARQIGLRRDTYRRGQPWRE